MHSLSHAASLPQHLRTEFSFSCVGTGAETRVVPADMLLLAGTCIVEEAVLTGESHPQWKTPVGSMAAPQARSLLNVLSHVERTGAMTCQ